ncbi:hypothetical protein WMY93_012495 [Mugilogobius chulae]|uniref:GED domain-containing protein n=1 Tax=Mugilogobius chulae TaxID=88201 RepID=A0AAW0PEE0_9GOBI
MFSPDSGTSRRPVPEVLRKVTAFTQDVHSLIAHKKLKCGEKINVFSPLRKEFERWKEILESSGNNFYEKIQDQEVYEEKYRGKELPGFDNFETFEDMVTDQIKQSEEPAISVLKNAGDCIKEMFLQLVNSHFKGFPNLLRSAKNHIESVKQDMETTAEVMLRKQFRMEMVVYTQDKYYRDTLSQYDNNNHLNKKVMSDEAKLQELIVHIKSYYKIASERLADQIPIVICYQMLEELASEVNKKMLQMIQEKDKIESLLKEDHDLGKKRADLQSRQKSLTEAREKLDTFC